MTAPAINQSPTTPSFDDLERKYGVGSSKPTGASAPVAGALSFTDLDKKYGLDSGSNADTGDIDLRTPADDKASKVRAILARKKAPAIAAASDQTNVGPYRKTPDYYGPSDALADLKYAYNHKAETAIGLATMPAKALDELLFAPVEGSQVSSAQAMGGKAGHVPGTLPTLPAGTVITKENSPTAITKGELVRSGINTAANIGLPSLPTGGLGARLAVNAGLGAVNDPDNPLGGAVAGSVLGELFHGATKVAPKVAEAAMAASDKVRTALADRTAQKAALPTTDATSPPVALRDKLADLIETPQRKNQRDQDQRNQDVSPLTNLPNKAAYDRALPSAEADPGMVILRGDLNGMKNAQDAVGSHAEGDKIIQGGAQAMQQAAAQIPGARVFHPSGDEFAAIVPSGQAETFRQAAEQAYGVKDHGNGAKTSLSIGIGNTDAAADAATYQRKIAQKAAQGIANRTETIPTGRIAEVPTSSLSRDPERFQFKQNVDEKGVGRELQGVEKYNPQLAGVLSVWKDPADGKTYVVNGHHRLELAERTGQPTVAVQHIDAPNAAEARAQGALINIAEGRGTAVDAAKVFRDSNMSPEDVKATGVSLSGQMAKSGLSLAKLDPSVFDKVARGQLTASHGAIIGSELDRPEQQIAAANIVEKAPRVPSNAEVAEISRQVKNAGSNEGTQEGLFGAEQLSQSLIHERAQVAAELSKRLSSDKRLFGFVGKEGRAHELTRGGNQIDVEGSKAIGDESAQLLEQFNNQAHRSGPVGDLITEAARRVANGESPKAVASDIYPRVTEAIRSAPSGGQGSHAGSSEGSVAIGESPASEREAAAVRVGSQPPEQSGARSAGEVAANPALTFDDLAQKYGVAPERPLASPERDLFGNAHETSDEQTGMFNDREGTASARSLRETEAAANSELESLRQHMELVRDPQERQRVASRVAQLERLVNRDRAITPAELSTRAAAEASENRVENRVENRAANASANAPALEGGVTQGVLLSPALDNTPTGSIWRRKLGLNATQSDRVTALRQISLNLADAVGVPIHEGRGNLNRMRALGAFWTNSEVIRVRRLKAVETVSHEVGHFLSKTQGIKDLLRSTTSKADRVAMRGELVAAGRRLYGARKPNGGYGEEGIAEWAKFRITDRKRVAAEFPVFGPFAEHILDENPALKVAMDKAQADFARYQASPANARLRSMIATKLPSRFTIDPNAIVDYAFDDLAPFRRAADELGTTNDPNQNAYTLARLTKGNQGRAKDITDHGVTDFNNPGGPRLTRGLPEILHEVAKDRDAFTEYFVARQVLTKTAQGIDTGFDVPAAQHVVDAGNMNPAFVEAAEELWKFRQSLLRMRADVGMLTPDELTAITNKNPTPTPFYRSFDKSDRATPGGARAGKGFAKNSTGIHTLKGSDRPILDPIESIISDTYDTVDAVYKHYAASVLIKSALETEGGGQIASILPEAPKTRVAIPIGAAMDQLVEAGWTPPEPGNEAATRNIADGVLQAFYQKPSMGGREVQDMVMPMLVNGERKWVQINDRALWDAVQGMSKPELGIFGKIFGAPTRMLRMGATQFNPDFALTNPLRDAFDAAVYSQGPIRPPFYHLFRGLFHIAREKFGDGDALFDRWAQEGGGNAGLVGSDRRALRSEYHKMLREVSANQSFAHALTDRVKHPLSTAREFFETFENATRLGEFALVRDKLMKEGMSEQLASRQAALASRDVTLDFSKAGRGVRTANQFVPFLAAHMADIEKLAREHNYANLRTPEGRARMARVVARAVATVTVPSVALYLAQRDDPDYQEIPEYVKAMSWVIVDHGNSRFSFPIGLKNGKRTRIWVIPRPHLLGFVYGYLPEKTLAWIDGHDPHALDHTASQTVQALTPPWVPTFAAPVIEAWSNKSTFTGNPIIPASKLRLTKPEQVQSHTGELARLLGRYTNQSPAIIEQVARDFTGGAGMAANDVVNAGIRSARRNLGMEPLAPENLPPADELKRIPVLRRFVMDRPSYGSQSVQDVFSHYDQAEAVRSTWRQYLKQGRVGEAAQYFKDHKAEILSVATAKENGTPGVLNQVHKGMLAIQKQINEVRDDNHLTPQKKNQIMQILDGRLVEYARRYTHPPTGAPR